MTSNSSKELEPVAEAGLNLHLAAAKNWNPHDYVPWSDGAELRRDSAGQDWDLDQSRLSEVARIAMITNLLTEDNLPSYHRAIAEHFTPRRRLGHLGQSLDGRGEPARHRAARLSGRHQGRGSGRAGTGQDAPGHRGLQSRPAGPGHGRPRIDAGHARLRHVPGARHPRVAPQHRQGVRRVRRRPAAQAGVRRRKPAHDLLPGRGRRRPGHRTRSGDARHLPDPGKLPDARLRDPQLPSQRRQDRRQRHLRPAPASRRGGAAGAPILADLRARRLHRRGAAAPRRTWRCSSRTWNSSRPSSRSRRPVTWTGLPRRALAG